MQYFILLTLNLSLHIFQIRQKLEALERLHDRNIDLLNSIDFGSVSMDIPRSLSADANNIQKRDEKPSRSRVGAHLMRV